MTEPSGAGEAAAGEDGSLLLPALPRLTRELGTPSFHLRCTPLPDADPGFTIAGARARAEGGHARGVDEVRASSIDVLSRLRVESASVVTSTLTPLGLERVLETDGGAVVERVAVPRADAVCFFEWSASREMSLTVSWRIEPTAPGALRWRVAGRALVVEAGRNRALYVFSRTPEDFAVTAPMAGGDQRSHLEVRARLELEAAQSVRMVVAGIGAGEEEARLVRVMDRAHVVVPARRAEATRILEDRLVVEAHDETLAEALSWSKLRLMNRGVATPDARAPISRRDARLALASLATGDADAAREVVAAAGIPAAEGPQDPAESALRILVAARYLAWTGDLPTLKGAWKGLRARTESCLLADTDGADASLLRVADGSLLRGALREMLAAAEEVGDGELAGRLRAAAGDPGRALDAAALAADGAADGDVDPMLRSAALIEALIHGLLGVEPDASRGRLVLRPRLPGSWTRFAVRKLRIGGANVAMLYTRAARSHTFTLRQDRGPSPLRVILEPELEGARLLRARVDGEPAALDAVPAEGRLRVPIQLVLDHERRVEVEIERPDA